ncbi:unnamed protein product, partial [Vitis vinifera]|uniref:Lipoprotein n=1 Tax=Vitis vinifera TaxID=29760 RepID=D7UCA0_VITVI
MRRWNIFVLLVFISCCLLVKEFVSTSLNSSNIFISSKHFAH